ncbi:TPA: DNA polymerase III subunit alpha [Candidatus Sumerlaeota bacterium]|nr:DNA polymerase III subunit alpha [Candidatus Sumerlaeota bacterium]
MSTPPPFVHLHVHSQYSLLDGVSHFKPLFNRVKELGMDSIALTDHGNMFGSLNFFKEANASGVRPIIGCEVYVSPSNHKDRTSNQAKIQNHLVLLAKDYTGYLNLCHLVSKGFLEGFYYKPRIDKEMLAAHHEGLIAMSACTGGILCRPFLDKRPKDAYQTADDFAQIMGPDNFYVELMDHGLPDQKIVLPELIALARKMNLPMVATNDSHYLRREDAKTQNILIAIGTNKSENVEGRFHFDGEDYYLKSPEEMAAIFGHVEGAIENTVRISEMCHSEIKLKQKDLIPEYITENGQSPTDFLRDLSIAGLKRHYGDITPAIQERFDYEFGIITQMGFVSYFLVVWDFVNFARRNNIPVGCRGSGAGSIVAYALAITELDPIARKLFFERFLNPERVSMPDFDIDLCQVRRQEVIEYVRNKYGSDNVAQIITFNTMKAKAAVRDVGRVKSIPLNMVDRIAKMIPEGPKVSIESALKDSPELKEAYELDHQVTDILDAARKIEGTVRQPGVHAAGVVVCRKPLIEALPLYKQAGKEDVVTQYNMIEVEEVGLLKVDFLGLKTLTMLQDCVDMVKKLHNISIDWDEVGFDDPKTYELLQRGDGFGVFQVESSGMRDLLRKARPLDLEEITVLIAAYRPGPMQFLETYINRKHKREETIYPHPSLEEPLKETYGLMIYQEQVMQTAQVLAGFSLGAADLLRRAMSKKKKSDMEKYGKDFVAGAEKKGVDPKVAKDVFDMIEQFAQYGFNKAHAASYAVLTYRTAYLKAHYPAEFMASLLTSEIRTGASDKLGPYISVARDMGLEVMQPDINRSQMFFSVVEGNIRFGLAAIKNVGQGCVEHIIQMRDKDGPYTSFTDFCERIDQTCVNGRALECLITCGAFDSLDCGTRPQLLDVLKDALEMGASKRSMKASGQTSLFDLLEATDTSEAATGLQLRDIPDWPDRERFAKEKELAGMFLSGHPLDRFRIDFRSFGKVTSSGLAEIEDGTQTALLGLVTAKKEITTKNGDLMAFVELEDLEGKVEIVFFPRTYEQSRDIIMVDSMLFVEGKAQKRVDDAQAKILADKAQRLEDLRRTKTRFLDILLPWESLEMANLEKLRGLMRDYAGNIPVRLRVQTVENGEVLIVPHARYKVNLNESFLGAFDKLKFQKSVRFAEK